MSPRIYRVVYIKM